MDDSRTKMVAEFFSGAAPVSLSKDANSMGTLQTLDETPAGICFQTRGMRKEFQIAGFTMKIAISATNPCHLYPLALELAKLQSLDCYYSGYPKWKLQDAERLHI